MARQGKISKSDALLPVQDEKKPFELPERWEWARFGSIAIIATNSVRPHDHPNLPHIAPDNIQKGTGKLLDYKTVIEDDVQSINHRFFAGQLLYSKIRPNLSKATVVDFDGLCSADMYPITPLIDTQYLLRFILSKPFLSMVVGKDNRVAMPKINQTELNKVLIAVPPLAEQHRIVARVEQLFAQTRALREKLAHSQTELARLNESALAHLLAAETPEEFHERWTFVAEHFDTLYSEPEHIAPLRQAILELAVRGKLTRRELDDEPASYLLERIRQEKNKLAQEGKVSKSDALPPITEDEKPFELPEGWEWVRFGRLGEQRLGQMLDQQKNKGEYFPYLRNANVQWLRIDFTDVAEMRFEVDKLDEYKLRMDDLLICEGGEPGRCAIWERDDLEMTFQKAIHRVRPYSGIVPKYLVYHLWGDAGNGTLSKYFTGATIKHFTGKALATYLVALPPIAEQHRIVARVEQLMKFCDALEAKLTAAQDERERLTAALLAGIEGVING